MRKLQKAGEIWCPNALKLTDGAVSAPKMKPPEDLLDWNDERRNQERERRSSAAQCSGEADPLVSGGDGSSDLLGQWLARMRYEVGEEWKLFAAQRLLDEWGDLHFWSDKYHRYVAEQNGIHGRRFRKPRLWKRLVAKLA